MVYENESSSCCGVGRPCRNIHSRLHDQPTSLCRAATDWRGHDCARANYGAASRAWDSARAASWLDGGWLTTPAHASNGSGSGCARTGLRLDHRLL
jgi:hypothetical protein